MTTEQTLDEACRRLVSSDILVCVSTLIYELRGVAEQLDDYETYLDLNTGMPNYEDACRDYIDGMDREDVCQAIVEAGEAYEEDADTSTLRGLLFKTLEESDTFKDFTEDHDVDAYDTEIYEHWAVTAWLGNKLKERGERVEEYMGLTIWGRGCTGQSISIDDVICQLAKEFYMDRKG